MPLAVKPYNYTNGQTIDANQLDQNLDTLYNLVNGALDAVNIAANGISDPTKIAAETVTQAKTKGVIYSQDLYGQSWVVSGGVVTASGSPANQVTVTTLVANILQADGSYRHVSVSGTTYVTAIINATYYLELQPDGTMNWAQTHSLQSGYMSIATVTSDGSGNILLITDTRITDPKLKGSLNNTIYTLEREVANLKAASSIANRVDGATGIFYDLNDGLNGGSAGKIDNTKTNSTGTIAVSAGTISVPVSSTTGFIVGQEVTIFDDVNLERRIITAISAGVSLSFAAMTNSYKVKAQICRSSVIQDTVNKLLKFGGWSYLTTYTNTAVNVVASAYDTSGNGGRKIVQLSNGWFVAGEYDSVAGAVMLQKYDGTSWSALCNITTGGATTFALTSFGTRINVVFFCSNLIQVCNFDATTVTNINIYSTKVTISTLQTAISGISITTNPANGNMTFAGATKNATYSSSFNIISAKSTDGGVTWTKQDGTAGVDQVSSLNTSGTDLTNPCVIYKSNNIPIIVYQHTVSTGPNAISCFIYSPGTWGAKIDIYTVGTAAYSQSNPCAIVKQNGSNIGRIVCRWQGLDATDTTKYNERWSYSDDGGATWSTTVKITSGNTVDRKNGSLSEDSSGNIFDTYMDSTSVVYQNCPNGTTTFGTLTTLNATGSNPSSVERMNFTIPPTIYMSGSTVKFDGTFQSSTTTPVLVEDVRYNINPPANVSSAVAWVDHDADANYSVAGAVSFQASGGIESFASMTKTTAAMDGTHNEDQFTGSGTAAAKATLRLTLTRNSTALVKNISEILGAVGT